MDAQVEKNLQLREISKVKDAFYERMQTHYQIRKSKEYITLKCGKLCYNKGGSNYMEDDLTRFEKNCLVNCYHKTYRFLVHANTAYSFFTGDE